MITIISGKVTRQDVEDADLMAGIVPTAFMSNGRSKAPDMGLSVDIRPICPKLPDIGERQRNWTMVIHADALIVKGPNEHLVACARRYNLSIYEC